MTWSPRRSKSCGDSRQNIRAERIAWKQQEVESCGELSRLTGVFISGERRGERPPRSRACSGRLSWRGFARAVTACGSASEWSFSGRERRLEVRSMAVTVRAHFALSASRAKGRPKGELSRPLGRSRLLGSSAVLRARRVVLHARPASQRGTRRQRFSCVRKTAACELPKAGCARGFLQAAQ